MGHVTPSASGALGSPRRPKAPIAAIMARDSAMRPARLAEENATFENNVDSFAA